MTAIQFICLFLAAIVVHENEMIRTVIGDLGAFCICGFLLPKRNVDELFRNIEWEDKCVKLLFGFILFIISAMLLQDIILKGIYAELFVFSVPAIILLLFVLGKWSNSKTEAKNMKQEIRINKDMQGKYDELLTKVRMRQHELKNHMTAIFATHYTYHTYEMLVKAQAEYIRKLNEENRFSSLLLTNNNILAGFLYQKFQEAETEGLKVIYKIEASIVQSNVPDFYLIEIVGGLIDNAIEAVAQREDEKELFFSVSDDRDCYKVIIRNRYPYVSYAEIEKWFMLGQSSKGSGRGIGLYQVKNLCKEWDIGIGCRSIAIDEKNWIEFALAVDKADIA